MTTTNSNSALKNYILVTIAYWGLTITDGAIRMLVLLHFHTLGYTPIQNSLSLLILRNIWRSYQLIWRLDRFSIWFKINPL